MSKISVVIPTCKNRLALLNRAIKSCLSQNVDDLEIIIINDGGSKEVETFIKSFRDTRLKYFYQSNQGPSAARNKGINLSSGEYIAFLDDDDFLKRWSLRYRSKFLDIQPDYDCIAGSVITINNHYQVFRGHLNLQKEGARNEEIRAFQFDLRFQLSQATTPEQFANTYKNYIIQTNGGIPFLASATMLRKHVFAKVGLFNEELRNSEDVEFFYRLSTKCKIKYDFMRVFAFVQRQDEGISRKIRRGEQANHYARARELVGF